MTSFDALRPPAIWDPSQDRYKDWLHLNVFDHATGAIGLINASLHGSPLDPRSRVLGTAVVNTPNRGWIGNVEIAGFREAAIGAASIGLSRTAVAISPENNAILASVRDPDIGLLVKITARPTSPSIDIEEQLPLADGWISWYVIPRLQVSGTWTLDSQKFDFEKASAYHDHNWGRWHWGDNFGWEWGCFLSPDDSSFVIARTTDRAHTHFNKLSLFVQAGQERRTFSGSSIELYLNGELSCLTRRLPGAMAALHQDRACSRLPRELTIHAADGIDDLQLEFKARDALQLIAADPIAADGFTFIHELAGEFTYRAQVGGAAIGGKGLGIFEYVD